MTSLLTWRPAIVSALTLAQESTPVIFPHHGDKRNVCRRAWFIELHGGRIWDIYVHVADELTQWSEVAAITNRSVGDRGRCFLPGSSGFSKT